MAEVTTPDTPFECVLGTFDQAPESKDIDVPFPKSIECFGLSEKTSNNRWKVVETQLDEKKELKSLIIGRHGQSVHNLALEKFGQERWQKELRLENGKDDLTWGPDAKLTKMGEDQARSMNTVWRKELQCSPPIPKPSLFYCLPFQRTAKTLTVTFDGIFEVENDSVIIREKLREKLDGSTTNKRLNMKVLKGQHPRWTYEKDAPEDDIWWSGDKQETPEECKERAKEVINEIFELPDKCISITAHEGLILGLLKYIGHPINSPPLGGAFAVLVRKQPEQGRGAF